MPTSKRRWQDKKKAVQTTRATRAAAKDKPLVMHSFPHSRPGRPRHFEDMVGAPV